MYRALETALILIKCSACKALKRSSDFYPDKYKKNGLRSQCKQCCLRTREEDKEKHRAYVKQHYKKNLELYKKKARISRLAKFGLTLKGYEILLRAQNGKCALCLSEETAKNRHLAVDHCHSTGKIRALLCQACNTGLGKFKDSLELLDKAIRYLKYHGK